MIKNVILLFAIVFGPFFGYLAYLHGRAESAYERVHCTNCNVELRTDLGLAIATCWK